MTFPIINDYRAAVRNAAGRFATLDVDPLPDESGEPMFMAGNFSAVFKVKLGGLEPVVALKFFIRTLPDLEKRFKVTVQIIEKAKARYLVDMAFLPSEVFVTSTIAPNGEYPVVIMPWIEGETLGFVLNRVCAKENRKGLAAITTAWANLCLDMLSKGIAHGDLKHDNVLVTPDGQLRLIDYDSMFAPPLKGLRAVLLGGASYQHPRRETRHFDRTLDHFSMLVITLSLRALTVDPSLCGTFNTGENIILGRNDFLSGGRTELMDRLLKSPDPLVRKWTALLIKVCRARSIEVPGLDRVLKAARKVPVEPARW